MCVYVFHTDANDEMFKEEKALLIREISMLGAQPAGGAAAAAAPAPPAPNPPAAAAGEHSEPPAAS